MAEADQFKLEQDGERFGTEDSTSSLESEEVDLSFDSHSEDSHEIENITDWRARNNANGLKLLFIT